MRVDSPPRIQPLIKKLSKQHVLTDGLAMYRKLQADDQDSVRLLTVEDLIALAQQLSPPEVKTQLLKQIRQTMTDKSWRVRYMAASHFNEVRFIRLAASYTAYVCMEARRGSRPGTCAGRAYRPLRPTAEGQRS